MRVLNALLGNAFKAPKARQPDPYRKSRPEAKRLAAQLGVEIEALRPGFNVWPPKAIADTDKDEFKGDHYAENWDDVLERVKAYGAAVGSSAGASA